MPATTPANIPWCRDNCVGVGQYFGIQYTDQCWCGDDPGSYGELFSCGLTSDTSSGHCGVGASSVGWCNDKNAVFEIISELGRSLLPPSLPPSLAASCPFRSLFRLLFRPLPPPGVPPPPPPPPLARNTRQPFPCPPASRWFAAACTHDASLSGCASCTNYNNVGCTSGTCNVGRHSYVERGSCTGLPRPLACSPPALPPSLARSLTCFSHKQRSPHLPLFVPTNSPAHKSLPQSLYRRQVPRPSRAGGLQSVRRRHVQLRNRAGGL